MTQTIAPSSPLQRAVLRIAGADARSFLQGVITQDMENVSPERAAFSALLTPQGKLLFDFFIAEDADGFLIDCAETAADALAHRLKLYKLRAKVTVERLDGWGVSTSVNLGTAPTVVNLIDPRLDGLGARAIGPAEALPQNEPYEQYTARRLSFGVPEFGPDFVSEEVFPLDVNYDALNGVNYKKGCFVGQEVASRMKRKGDVRKRTAIITNDDGASLASGAPVTAGETTLGTVLSASGGIGLALIRLDRLQKVDGDTAASGEAPVRITIPSYLETL